MDEITGMMGAAPLLGNTCLGTAILTGIAVSGVYTKKLRVALYLCAAFSALMAMAGAISWINPAAFAATATAATAWPVLKGAAERITAHQHRLVPDTTGPE